MISGVMTESIPHDTVLVPAEDSRPALTHGETEALIIELMAVEGELNDLCSTAAYTIAVLAGRIHRLGAAGAPTKH